MTIINMAWVPWWLWDLWDVITYARSLQLSWTWIRMKTLSYNKYSSSWYSAEVTVPTIRVFNWRTVLWFCTSYQQNSWWWWKEYANAYWYKNWVFRFLSISKSQNTHTNRWYWWTASDWELYYVYCHYDQVRYDYYKFNFENNSIDTYSYATEDWENNPPPGYQDAYTSWSWTASTTIVSWDTTVNWYLDYSNTTSSWWYWMWYLT